MYKPFKARVPDLGYTGLLQTILHKGHKMQTPFHGQSALRLLGVRLEFDMREGFPLTTLRSVKGSFKQALGEIIAFMNGAHTQEELKYYGCTWWDRWVTEERCKRFDLPTGELGRGSYGPVLQPQIIPLLDQMREYPTSRTHVLTTWDPQFAIPRWRKPREVVVAPCHGTVVHFNLDPETKELELVHVQRSGDVPVGVVFNIVHYAAMGMMFAQVLGYTMGRLVHIILDAHIYEEQIPYVEKLLERAPNAFPTVTLDPKIEHIFDFRAEHFALTDYDPHPALNIPTPT